VVVLIPRGLFLVWVSQTLQAERGFTLVKVGVLKNQMASEMSRESKTANKSETANENAAPLPTSLIEMALVHIVLRQVYLRISSHW